MQAQNIQQSPPNIAHTVRETSVIVESLRRVLPPLVSPYSFLQRPGQEQIMPRMVGAVERSPAQCNKHTRRTPARWSAARSQPNSTNSILSDGSTHSKTIVLGGGSDFYATRREQRHVNFGRKDAHDNSTTTVFQNKVHTGWRSCWYMRSD